MDPVWILTKTEYMGVETGEHLVGVFVSRQAIEHWLDAQHGNLVEWNDFDESYWITNSTVRYRPDRWDVTE
jgi:hypothetical protein